MTLAPNNGKIYRVSTLREPRMTLALNNGKIYRLSTLREPQDDTSSLQWKEFPQNRDLDTIFTINAIRT